jgi:NodT family efflux transporter outer membrane factor (OMF) lipoprotein
MRRYVPMTGLQVYPAIFECFSNLCPSRFKVRRRLRVLAVASLLITGCTVGPKYVKPSTEVPSSYKETAQNFKEAHPSDQIGKGKWWEIYNDPQLNDLEEQIRVSNQTLKAAQAQFEAARAAIRVAHSQAFPNITGGVSGTHNSESFNRPLSNTKLYYQDYVLPVDVSYEPDLWGRVRRLVEANRSEAQATAADLANVDLSLHAELAVDYFQLRGLDAQKKLLDSTVESYTRALELTQSRYHGGVATAVDVAQAQTQLETTRAQAIDVEANRAAFEHAIAALVGKPASSFALPPLSLSTPPPPVPPGVPSDLLERRPDIAAAERRVEEANAQIGVAKAAYYPNVNLSAGGGFESGAIGTFIQGASGFWTLAGSAAELIFDGGQRRGVSDQTRALYEQSVDNYRQTVLVAFQEVEDNLAALRVLQEEAKTEDAAVAAAQHSLDLSTTRYKGGVTNYLEVTTAQSAALSDEVTALEILIRRMNASVLLIKAIGGGWNVSQIPHV